MAFNFFFKNSYPKLESFYLNSKKLEELSAYTWVAMAANQRSFKDSLITKELVLSPIDIKTNPTRSYIVAEAKNGLYQKVHDGAQKIFDGTLREFKEIKNAKTFFNDITHSLIEREIKYFTSSMNAGDISLRQAPEEEKSLEWLKVTFQILEKGTLESFTNPDYLFQSTLFLGVNPKNKPENVEREIRLITFNLDINFLLLNDHNLRVLIYNKKPGAENDLKPALMGDFSYRKKEMFDLFINLLSIMTKGYEA